jgi:hypothetical protein
MPDTYARLEYEPERERIHQATEEKKGLFVFVTSETAARIRESHERYPDAKFFLRRIPAYGHAQVLKHSAQIDNGDDLVVALSYDQKDTVIQLVGQVFVTCEEGRCGLVLGDHHSGRTQLMLVTAPLKKVQGGALMRLFTAQIAK